MENTTCLQILIRESTGWTIWSVELICRNWREAFANWTAVFRVWCDPANMLATRSDSWFVCQRDNWWVGHLQMSPSHRHNRPIPIACWNKFEFPTDMCRPFRDLWYNESMDSSSAYFWWPSGFAKRRNFGRAARQTWPATVTSHIVAATPNLGQSIYFLYSIRVERAHMCRAWAIHASKVIRLVFLKGWNFKLREREREGGWGQLTERDGRHYTFFNVQPKLLQLFHEWFQCVQIEGSRFITEGWSNTAKTGRPYAMNRPDAFLWWQQTDIVFLFLHPLQATGYWPTLCEYQHIELVIVILHEFHIFYFKTNRRRWRRGKERFKCILLWIIIINMERAQNTDNLWVINDIYIVFYNSDQTCDTVPFTFALFYLF